LLVLMFVAQRMLGEHAGRYEYLTMCAIVIGVIGAGLTAPPLGGTDASAETITIVLVALALASLLPYLFHAFERRPPVTLTMLAAGLGFAWSGVATKLASDDLAQGHVLRAVAWGLSTAAASGVAVLSEMSALQSRPAIQVAPVVFVTQTVVPVALAPLLFGERFSATPLGGVPLALSLIVLIAGAALLERSPLLLALMEGERTSEASGSAASPSEPSQRAIRSSPSNEELDPSTVTTRTSPARAGR
jgi:drug/metabolite transporter (DMT)-like permease